MLNCNLSPALAGWLPKFTCGHLCTRPTLQFPNREDGGNQLSYPSMLLGHRAHSHSDLRSPTHLPVSYINYMIRTYCTFATRQKTYGTTHTTFSTPRHSACLSPTWTEHNKAFPLIHYCSAQTMPSTYSWEKGCNLAY